MCGVKTLLRRSRSASSDGVSGTARIDRDPHVLLGRLRRGDVAVLDQVDLDRATATQLVATGVVAVVNASPTISGRYPSLGATVLIDAGVELLDGVGPGVLTALRDGATVRLVDNQLLRGDDVVATGTRQTPATVTDSLTASEAGLSSQMSAFAASAAEYLRREHRLLLEPATIPTLRPALEGRDVIVVAPGPDHRDDLARLRPYAKEYKPAVIAVDEAADTARELGFKPTVVVGDLSAVSDEAIRNAQDVVVCLDGDAGTAGLARVDRMGVARTVVTTTARPQDLALLMADEAGARVIITAGSDRTLVSMLDSGRTAAAADFVTRLRVGSRLVDAQAIAATHRPRVSGRLLTLLLLVALLALGTAAWLTPTGQDVVTDLTDRLPASVSEAIDTLRGTSPEEPSP
jgi:uncharacterized membrane-anchored protein